MNDAQVVNEARTIDRLPVTSSSLKTIGYDVARSILAIEFQSGAIFHYYQVPLELAQQLNNAESTGRFYAKEIRGKFIGKPMTGKCQACGATGLILEKCEFCDEGTYREIDRVHTDE